MGCHTQLKKVFRVYAPPDLIMSFLSSEHNWTTPSFIRSLQAQEVFPFMFKIHLQGLSVFFDYVVVEVQSLSKL